MPTAVRSDPGDDSARPLRPPRRPRPGRSRRAARAPGPWPTDPRGSRVAPAPSPSGDEGTPAMSHRTRPGGPGGHRPHQDLRRPRGPPAPRPHGPASGVGRAHRAQRVGQVDVPAHGGRPARPHRGEARSPGSTWATSRPGPPRRSCPTTRCSTTTSRCASTPSTSHACTAATASDDYAQSLCERLGPGDRIDDLPAALQPRVSARRPRSCWRWCARSRCCWSTSRSWASTSPASSCCSSCSTRCTPTVPPPWWPPTIPPTSTASDRSIALRDGEVVFDGKASVDQVLGPRRRLTGVAADHDQTGSDRLEQSVTGSSRWAWRRRVAMSWRPRPPR
jgi:hypothetical protein